jgi:hypothetical protein
LEEETSDDESDADEPVSWVWPPSGYEKLYLPCTVILHETLGFSLG